MSKSRSIEIGSDTRSRILSGALTLTKTVAVTFGPMGRNALIDRFAGLLSTRDGVTVAREIDLPDALANQGCQILKQACVKVNDEVGDGTTQTAILAAEMLREGHRLVSAGFQPNALIKGMKDAVKAASEAIDCLTIPVETQDQIQQVAFLASNRDTEISTLLAEATMAVGKDGLVVIEDGQGIESTLELKEGMEIENGMVSQHFADNEERITRTLDAPLVAVINAHLRTMDDVKEVMEVASQWPNNQLLIFCRSIAGEALTTLILNHQQKVVSSCAVEAPGMDFRRPDILADIAALAGATFVDHQTGYDYAAWDPNWFGSIRKATMGKKSTLLEAYPEAKDTVAVRLEWLHGEEGQVTSDYDRDQLRKRIAKLSGGMALLKVGGSTESELKDRRARVEDALGAVKAALRGGLVPGGGMSYIQASYHLKEVMPDVDAGQKAGWDVVRKALLKPLEILANNAGCEGKAVVAQMMEYKWDSNEDGDQWFGWDALTGVPRDLRKEPPVMDPTLVPVTALEAALSVAATLLTVEASVFKDSRD